MKRNRIAKKGLLISIHSFVMLFLTVNIYAGTPHTVYGDITYNSEAGISPVSATVTAYIVSRPGEHISGTYYPGSGSYVVQCGNFGTDWTAGNVLHVDVDDGQGGTSSGEVALTNGPYEALNLIIVTTKPFAPVIGSVAQPTCALATGSVTLNDLPDPWKLTQYPGGATYNGTGTSATISDLAPETYTFTVTNSIGSTSVESEPVVINNQPVAPGMPGAISGNDVICAGSQQSYSISAVDGATAYSWTLPDGWVGSSSSATITVNAGNSGGSVSVTALNGCGASPAKTISVSIVTKPSAPGEISGPGSLCINASGNYAVTHDDNASSYTWSLPPNWTGVSSTCAIDVTAASGNGNISVVANNVCGSSTASTISVSSIPLPAQPGSIDGESSLCLGSGDTYSISAVDGALSYTWTLPSGWSGSSITMSIDATANGSSGNISVKANNSCGSGPEKNLAVSVLTKPAQPGNISGNASVCEGASESYSISAVSGATSYLWTLPSGWSGTSIKTSINATAGNTGGTISVAAVNTCGTGTTKSISATIAVVPSQPGDISGLTSLCEGVSQTYSIDAVDGATSYTWTLPSGWTGTSTTYSINAKAGANSGNITVSAGNSCGTSSARSVPASVTTLPAQPGQISGDNSLCEGTTETYSISSVSGASSYTWTLPSGWSGSSSITSVEAVANGGSGTISVKANNSCGSGPAKSLSISVQTKPDQPGSISGDDAVCNGEQETYSISQVGDATGYTWTLPSGWSGSSASNSISATAGSSGGTISVTANNGCGSGEARNLNISVSANPSIPAVGTITQPTCVDGGSVELSGLPSSGSWKLTRSPDGSTYTGSGVSYTVNDLWEGTYNFSVSNASGCASLNSSVVTIVASPGAPATPVVSGKVQPTCNEATGSVSLSSLPGSGTWKLTTTPGSTVTGTGTTTTIQGLSQGTYSFKVTDAKGCVSGSVQAVINAQPPVPSSPVIGSLTQPTCLVTTGSVVLNGLPSSGNWTLKRNPGNIATTGSGTSKTVSGLESGNYTYTITNESGCVSVSSAGFTINGLPDNPSVPAIGAVTQPTCAVATGSVEISNLPSGSWTLIRIPGSNEVTGTGTSKTISNIPPGTFTYKVSDANGCISAESAGVLIQSAPNAPTAPVVGVITHPTTLAAGTVILSGLPAAGSWTINAVPSITPVTGSGSVATIPGLPAGTYIFTVTNASGCVSPATGDVFLNAFPVITNQLTINVNEDDTLIVKVSDLIITDPDTDPSELSIKISDETIYPVAGLDTLILPADYFGTITVPVQVFDGIAWSAVYDVTINVISVNDKPKVTEIPDQTVEKGTSFDDIDLNGFIIDETPDNLITWVISGELNVHVVVTNGIAVVTANNQNWTGSDTVFFTATDDDAVLALSETDTVIFKVIPVTGFMDEESVKIVAYPNPTNNLVTFIFSDHSVVDISLEVYALDGKMVYIRKQPLNNGRIELHMDDWESGVYIVRMIAQDNSSRLFKITRQ